MNKIKLMAVSTILAMPMLAVAGGVGAYIPVELGYTETRDYEHLSTERSFDYGQSYGIGFVLDNNLGKDKLVNSRFNIEYISQNLSNTDFTGIPDETYSKWNMASTLGFGVVRTQHLRFWIGPRFNVGFKNYDTPSGSTREDFQIFYGIAAATGLNYNINKHLSIGIEADYRFQFGVGEISSTTSSTGTSYTMSDTGIDGRVYVMYRYGESFLPEKSVVNDVVDQSL